MTSDSGRSRRSSAPPHSRRRCFTLTEILIVVVILGILAGLVLPHYVDTARRAKVSSMLADLQTVRDGLQRYRTEHRGHFPALDQMWESLIQPTDDSGTAGAGDLGPYLKALPVNQFSRGSAVATDTSADWEYNAQSGRFRGLAPDKVIAEFDISPLDAVALPPGGGG